MLAWTPAAAGRRAVRWLATMAALLAVFCRPAGALDYVALGDSIAAGVGDGGGGGFPARYRADLEIDLGTPVVLHNLAVAGSTSQDLLTALTGDATMRAAIAGADVVTLDIGGNDILIGVFAHMGGTCGGADGEDCLRQAITVLQANWPAIVSELRALNPSATMRTMDYYNPFIATPGTGTVTRKYVEQLHTIIAAAALPAGVGIAATYAAFNGGGQEDPVAKGYIDTDGIHPSALGHTVIGDRFRAVGYSPLPGTLVRIPSSSLVLKDDADPTKRKIAFNTSTKKSLTGAERIVPPVPGSAQDPTSGGATLIVYNAAGLTTDQVEVVLPAEGWSVRAKGGFQFAGTGPVSKVILAADRIYVKGGGPAWTYSLDEPAQGAVAVRLRLDGGWCAVAPAKVAGVPPSTAGNDHPGRFVGQRKAPAPVTCPGEPSSPSGAFVDTVGESAPGGRTRHAGAPRGVRDRTSTAPGLARSDCSGGHVSRICDGFR